MTKAKRRLNFDAPRELLLVEIARRCRACDAPARVGLTRAEARDYTGFECGACDEWNADELSEGDVPEWWEELRVTGLNTLRSRADGGADSDEPDSVKRLSDARLEDARGGGAAAEDSPDGSSSVDSPEDSF
jgi:hypothetical protein